MVCRPRGSAAGVLSTKNRQRPPPASVDIVAKRCLVVDNPAAAHPPPTSSTSLAHRFALNHSPIPDIVPLALLHPIFAESVAILELYEPTPDTRRQLACTSSAGIIGI